MMVEYGNYLANQSVFSLSSLFIIFGWSPYYFSGMIATLADVSLAMSAFPMPFFAHYFCFQAFYSAVR